MNWELILGIAVIIGLVMIFVYFGMRRSGDGVGGFERNSQVELANDDIMQVLARLFASHRRVLKPGEILRLRESKARAYHVRPNELLPDVSLLNDIYARVLENEFISAEERPKILACIEESIVLCREMEMKGDHQNNRLVRPKEITKSAA